MFGNIRASFRAFLFLLNVITLAPLQWLVVSLRLPVSNTALPLLFHKFTVWIFGLKITVIGKPSTFPSTLFISNHTSYLDIPILGSIIKASFVAKSEVRKWPLFGWLAVLQNTVFIERKVNKLENQCNEIINQIKNGGNVLLFPEGTTSDGNRIMHFKSSLFDIAMNGEGPSMKIQPVSIAYFALDDLPAGRNFRPLFAWYGDMALAPHLWQLAKHKNGTIIVEFSDIVNISDYASRKTLALHCHTAIVKSFERALWGHQDAC